jgi:hypothetical protein
MQSTPDHNPAERPQDDGGSEPRRWRRGSAKRPRSYDDAVLRYIGYYRVVTAQQVVYRFFVNQGRGYRYGYKLLRQLVERGLVSESMLEPSRGTTSLRVLELTPVGWAYLNAERPRNPTHADGESIRRYRIQFAEMMLEREAEGWTLVPATDGWASLQAWAMREYRGRMLNDTERVMKDRVRRMPPWRPPMNLLVHRDAESCRAGEPQGNPRFIIPVRRGKSFARLLEKLPKMGLFPAPHFEIVSIDHDLAEAARQFIERWARERGIVATIHQAPAFQARPHPERASERSAEKLEPVVTRKANRRLR